MPEEEIQNQNPIKASSHLIVEQGLFSRTTQEPTIISTLPETEDEILEEDANAYKQGGLLARFHLNLFIVLLVPLVIIEIILLVLVFKH